MTDINELVELIEDDYENLELTGELLYDIRMTYGVGVVQEVIKEVGFSTDLGAYHFAQLIRDHVQRMATAKGMTLALVSERRILDLAS